METKSLATVNGQCISVTLVRLGGSYETERTYEFRIEDLVSRRGTRGLTIVFTRRAIVDAHDFQAREHLFPWNALRKAFDVGELNFDFWPEDRWARLTIEDADASGTREPASDDTIRRYLIAKLYWFGHRYGVFDNPTPTWVHLDSDEDLDYLATTRNDILRVASRMSGEGLLRPSGLPGVANPTDKLLKLFEARPRGNPPMKEHQYALTLAARGKLPERIDASSHPSPSVIRELVGAGLLKALDASSMDGPAYLNPEITLAGREYLARLGEGKNSKQEETEMIGGKALDITNGVQGGRGAWLAIEAQYDVSKRTLGRQLSFVKDQFKKDVIFRDIEQAFVLAEDGFCKPSLILAGGVIEELLRLFLEHKNLKPDNNRLDSYIKCCEKLGFIKDAIHKLADAVRQFRNIVHLEKEKSAKDSISKATAKAAVSSIFTIAKQLGN